MKTRTLVGRSVTLVAALALSGAALAQDRHSMDVRTMTVRYADLNISTASGATTLYHRILGAARSVCGEEGSELDLEARHTWDDCFRSAVNDAVEKVHSPLLTAVHHKSTPSVSAMLSR
jgi:UrcA family protein